MKRFLHLAPLFHVFFGGIAINLVAGSGVVHAQSCCWNHSRAPAYPVGPPIPVTPTPPAGTAMNSYYGGYGMLPPSPGTVFPAGLPQTSAAFLPTASYDTRWTQTPVTYYRPVTQYDPNYGTTVTSLQPCTSYQYQAARVPLVSPRGINDYNYTANRWPVTAPGYSPAAAAPAPVYPSLQQLPAVGMPVTSNMMNYSTTGTSSGPASTLPLAVMSSPSSGVVSATHMAPMAVTQAPMAATQAAAWMPSTAVPSPQIPITSAVPGTGTPIYTVPATAPTTSLTPCPNGICTTANAPSIPGATSVVPIGPPTVMSQATPMTAPATIPLPSTAAASNPGFAPSVSNPVLPNPGDIKPILPPTDSADPEATRQPSLGSTGSTFPLKRIPVTDIDRGGMETSQPLAHQATRPPGTAPQPLPPSSLQPLKAPSDFDAKPRWNPKLLPPSSPGTGETVASTPTGFHGTV